MTITETGIHVDQATEQDVPRVRELICELAIYQNMLPEVRATEEALHDALFGPRPSAEVLIARHNGDVAGIAIFFMTFSSMLGRRAIYLDDLYVRAEWRGQGIGGALLTRLAGIAAARDCCRVEWMVLDWNESAIRFYERSGATLMREWTKCRLNQEAIAHLAQRS